MSNVIHLEFDDGLLAADAGCVTVHYVERRGQVQVIRKADKEILRIDAMPDFDLSEFITIVNKVKEICNHK